MEQFVFFVFAAVLLFAGTMVITARNPVHSALFPVLAVFSCAGLWLLLEAEFLALTLVVVYVGAVMVLFLFVVMMLDINVEPLREGFIRYLPVGAVVALLLVVELVLVLGAAPLGLESMPEPARHAADYSNTRELGLLLYTVYVYPFEIASVILLVAIVAAITLTMRRRTGLKAIDPGKQVAVHAPGRIRVVKMPAEPKQ